MLIRFLKHQALCAGNYTFLYTKFRYQKTEEEEMEKLITQQRDVHKVKSLMTRE